MEAPAEFISVHVALMFLGHCCMEVRHAGVYAKRHGGPTSSGSQREQKTRKR